MKSEKLPQLMIDTFRSQYEKLAAGETGLIPESEIKSVESLPDSDTLSAEFLETGKKALSKSVLIKLNGGLGTGMGLEKAKSLLKVKQGLTFLDIIARHAIQSGVPLVLMNSFSTREDSLAAISIYPELKKGKLPLDFLQHKAPKILSSDLSPAVWPANPENEWYPPGHGDLYTALVTSGVLDGLLENGIEYAFVSNADNLGASLDTSILGYFVSKEFPFMMECADRTEADKKGGHLAKRAADGQLLLRESAQCPKEDEKAFQDVNKYRYFNTNNLWINLKSLKNLLDSYNGVIPLPIIRNGKTIDPRDSKSPAVYQLETAMGSAIAVFKGAAAIRVPRSRFAPVKANSDLLAVRSDAYVLTDDYRVTLNPLRKGKAVVVDLDSKFYKLIDQMEERFPHGAPSLVDCDRLIVKGDVLFGRGVKISGDVTIEAGPDGQRVYSD
ncbi:MAG: UTP--glucose-1-phosphate uridylyltransferase [Fibrobacteres bacterium]|nr:UTP--glucose-1-phosphate uridylyltransferase [Fibrobacterota bacterium]